jgi:putative DNA primase/helicase
VDETDAIRRLLSWKAGRITLGPCLVIPFRRPDGSFIPAEEFCRLKPDRPRKRKGGGGVVKYEQPAGKPLRAYFPAGTIAALSDPPVPLGITEGEKKAAEADQEGFKFIGLTGVDCWTQNGEMIPDLAAVVWQGRLVYVVYDSDAAENYNFRLAAWKLAQALANRGAVVKVLFLPPYGGGKVGLDDFLVAHGPDALKALLDTAPDPVKPEKPTRPAQA